MRVGLSLCAWLLASASVSLFLVTLVRPRALWMEILCGVQYIWCIVAATSSLFGWRCCEDGCLM